MLKISIFKKMAKKVTFWFKIFGQPTNTILSLKKKTWNYMKFALIQMSRRFCFVFVFVLFCFALFCFVLFCFFKRVSLCCRAPAFEDHFPLSAIGFCLSVIYHMKVHISKIPNQSIFMVAMELHDAYSVG